MKVSYVCKWEKEKKKTWSGTSYSLYKSLNKYIDEVEDNGFRINKIMQKIIKLNEISFENLKLNFNKINNKFLNKYNQYQIKKIDKNLNDVVLEIGDLGISNKPYYIYQDLSLDFLIDYRKNNYKNFQFSNYEIFSEDDLKARSLWQKEIYNNATGIFTMSDFLAKHIIEYTGIDANKVHNIGAGYNLDTTLIRNVEKANKKILFVGRDFYRKGGDLVCDAFNILQTKYMNDAELFIAGADKKIKEKYSNERIHFLGDLPGNELSDYFNQCDIFCMPSRFEAFGIVFVEALLYGLPCIARNDFAMKEIIKNNENGFLIDSDNIDNLAKKMYELLMNSEIKKNVKNNFDYYKNEYSWDNVAYKIKMIIENDLIGG